MKKLTLALIASTIALSATQANIGTGFYAGGAVGYGGTSAKYAGFSSGAMDAGAGAANIGIHGGYGWLMDCLYVGGEIAATYDNTKFNETIATGQANPSGIGIMGGAQLKRNGYLNAALRGGYLLTPTTMLYLRLGANWSKWTLRDSGNVGNQFSTSVVGNGSRSRVTFVPGIGFETSLYKSLFLRLEYTYEFGPGVRANNGSVPTSSSMSNVRSQSGKIGFSHKFQDNGAVQAVSQANISSGFYGGGALGYGLTTAKYTVTLAPAAPIPTQGSAEMSGLSGNIGVHGGYGFVYNCFYVGGEAGYTFDQSKINDTTGAGVFAGTGGFQLKRSGYVGAALRGGYLVSPSTMLYLRLGGNWSKWKFLDSGTPTNSFTPTVFGTGSNTRVSFVPGLGLETALNKNVYVRGEYTYEFGPSIRATNTNIIGYTTISNIRSQSAKLGVSYKF